MLFGVPPTNLAVLPRKTNGVFPLNSVYEVIDERKSVITHGTRHMPIGDAEAQYNLALKYANGDGVPQDYAEAAKWYRRRASSLGQDCGLIDLNQGRMSATGVYK